MDYFPLSLATGKAFCNRVKEQKCLKYNIQESRPTLIVSPRRYGKTSLALQAIRHSKFDYAQFDFLAALDANDVERIILKGVGQLLGRLEKGPRKALKVAVDFFSGLSIKLSFDKLGLTVEINKKSSDPATAILHILERLEKLSEKYDKKIVLLFDEFQRIFQISDDQIIENAIRQVAQASKRLVFIFSGSSRHLLNKIFNDRDRPLYKLCDRITLDRISEQDYINYVIKAAAGSGVNISEKEIKRIVEHTERHPYYFNLLCSRLWRLQKISVENIDAVWDEYLLEERSQVANELELLSSAQRKLLITLSRHGGTKSFRSQEFQLLAGMPGTTIAQAMKFLEQRDYVFKNLDQVYNVLDPAIKAVLSET